jgi:hypothetical protein
MLTITSIDVGLYNLGIVMAQISEETFTIQTIIRCDRIDMKALVTNCGCRTLQHRLCMADYAQHLFRDYSEYFSLPDIILVERQPPGGIDSLQNLITFQFSDRVYIIHPISVHKFLNSEGMTYENRKIVAEKYAERFLGEMDTYISEYRRHDIADALCMISYYIKKLHDKDLYEKEIKFNEISYAKFEQFRYSPSES